jgi:hypothetical protein
MEAPALIEAKARNMLRHYVDAVLPNGFKAQVVAVSRRATLRYRDAFLKARGELVAEVEGLDPSLLTHDADARAILPERTQFLLRVHAHLPTIREMEVAPVIWEQQRPARVEGVDGRGQSRGPYRPIQEAAVSQIWRSAIRSQFSS